MARKTIEIDICDLCKGEYSVEEEEKFFAIKFPYKQNSKKHYRYDVCEGCYDLLHDTFSSDQAPDWIVDVDEIESKPSKKINIEIAEEIPEAELIDEEEYMKSLPDDARKVMYDKEGKRVSGVTYTPRGKVTDRRKGQRTMESGAGSEAGEGANMGSGINIKDLNYTDADSHNALLRKATSLHSPKVKINKNRTVIIKEKNE